MPTIADKVKEARAKGLVPLLRGDLLPCAKCGTQTDINLLDAFPLTADWKEQELRCETCYGPDWLPMAWTKRGDK